MKEVFERIYLKSGWGDGESRSGYGSDLKETEVIRSALPKLFEELSVHSILDVPCGDFNWMRLLDLNIDYIGADIVTDMIEKNRQLHAGPRRQFWTLDITKDPVPTVDLILCRDLLVHLSFEDIQTAIANINRSGSRYLLATTFPSRYRNSDIKTGEWRPLNLVRPPFSFPPPIRLIAEHCSEEGGQWADKCLGLWEVEAIADRAAQTTPVSGGSIAEHTPRVSVVIPTYNRAHLLGQAVASALGQTHRDLEVIVVDDGSTDATMAVLSSFSDPRLICIQQPNAGRSRARNVAIAAARGEFITFLDSDDYYLPFKVELQVSYLDANPDIGMVYTSAACIDDNGQPLNYAYHATLSGWIYPFIAFFVPHTITLPTVMVRREILRTIGMFDEAMVRFEDTDLWRRIAKRIPIAGINDITCHIRTHAGNRLESLDARAISSALDYYIGKVLTEDADLEPSVLQAGSRRLYEHYGRAMSDVSGFVEEGEKLLQKAKTYFNPMISIVMPVYNGANYLRAAIESVLLQTYSNIEIVVVNDGSKDEGATERVALSYGDRIRYFSKSNGGVASALNEAIREARGEFISWLSHDDLYMPDKLERQVGFLAQQPEPGNCVVYGDYAVFSQDSDQGTPVAMPKVESENFRYFITTQNILHGCTLLLPKAAFARHGWFNENLRTTQDYDLWFRMAKAERFIHLPGVVVRARSHAEQGTVRMIDVMMTEADQLLTNFVEGLTLEEVERGASCHPIAGYFVIADSLNARNFRGAAARSGELADAIVDSALKDIDRMRSREPGSTQDACVEALRAEVKSARLLRSQCCVLKTRSDELESQLASDSRARETLVSEIAALHRRLEDVYASSSWRFTRPLRLLGRGLIAFRRFRKRLAGIGPFSTVPAMRNTVDLDCSAGASSGSVRVNEFGASQTSDSGGPHEEDLRQIGINSAEGSAGAPSGGVRVNEFEASQTSDSGGPHEESLRQIGTNSAEGSAGASSGGVRVNEFGASQTSDSGGPHEENLRQIGVNSAEGSAGASSGGVRVNEFGASQTSDSGGPHEENLQQIGVNSAAFIERFNLLDERITQLASLLENVAKGVSILQHQVTDARSAVEARCTLLGANLVGLATRNEDEFRHLRLGASSGGFYGDPAGRAPRQPRSDPSFAVALYLNLIENALVGSLTGDGSLTSDSVEPYDPLRRAVGFDWPATAETMIGHARMRNLRMLLEQALLEDVPGDFIETGVWRGGACIYARAIFAAHGDVERRVFVADSFRGLPPPNQVDYPADAGDEHSTYQQLSVSRAEVETNFRKYGLLDERVVFLEGWFKDTLPGAPVERLCVLRLDGDMYESTILALDALYHKVSPGGFVIVDDYLLKPCAQAVDEFRARHGIHAPLHDIDGAAVWWRVADGMATLTGD